MKKLYFLILVLLGFGQIYAQKKQAKKTTKIMFVGNSLTYYHNIPKLLEEIGKLDHQKIKTTSFTNPDYSLEDHWNEGKVQNALQKEHFDFVVAQQGSSALPESQIMLKNYAQKYAQECKKFGTELNLYMVWSMKSRSFDFDNVIYSYTEATKFVNASLSPVGLAWKKVWEIMPNIVFYEPDGLHPTKKASILASMVIYAKLFKKKDFSFLDLSKTSWSKDLSNEEFELFKTVVSGLD